MDPLKCFRVTLYTQSGNIFLAQLKLSYKMRSSIFLTRASPRPCFSLRTVPWHFQRKFSDVLQTLIVGVPCQGHRNQSEGSFGYPIKFILITATIILEEIKFSFLLILLASTQLFFYLCSFIFFKKPMLLICDIQLFFFPSKKNNSVKQEIRASRWNVHARIYDKIPFSIKKNGRHGDINTIH